MFLCSTGVTKCRYGWNGKALSACPNGICTGDFARQVKREPLTVS